MYNAPMSQCYNCGSKIEGPIYRADVCPSCGKDVKVCLNCRFYSPGAHWDCNETIGEPVWEKDRGNFCDFFVLSDKGTPGNKNSKDSSESQKDAFNRLFSDD